MSTGTNEKEKAQMSYTELYDIPSGSIADIKEQLRFSMRHKAFRGVWCIVGEAGMGKSQIVHQLAEEEEARVCDIRTAHFGLMGTGIPSVKDAKGVDFFKIKLPEVFPAEGEKAIVMFDEINQGQQHAISMFFSMIEDRQMFNYFLPESALVVAMMNPNTAQYTVTQIENNAALRRRLKFIFAVPTTRSFLDHAATDLFHSTEVDINALGGRKPCHPDILEFFENKAEMIDDKKAREQNKQYTCPATIQTISLDAYLMENSGMNLGGTFASVRFAASIGETATNQLSAFLRDRSTAISPEDVLRNYGKVRKKVATLVKNTNQEALMDLNMNVLEILFAKQFEVDEVAENFVRFIDTQPPENVGAIMNSMKRVAQSNNAEEYLKTLMRKMYTFDEWVAAHKKLDKSHRAVDDDFKKSRKKKRR